jgi:hypothetical protein
MIDNLGIISTDPYLGEPMVYLNGLLLEAGEEFINDDYNGGEFVYWDGTRVKPKAGSMLIHPAGEDYFLKKVTGPTPKYYLFGYVRGNQNWIYAQLNQEKLDKMSVGLL